MTRPLDILRVLMGAVMVVTALDWFIPFLMPFMPNTAFSDPMAARIVDMLTISGLLAVAKFIQLAGGVLLILNRAAPFALAAMLPVNVCSTFIAVALESDPLLAVLALALLALNGLLMLAHLPYYRGVLQSDRTGGGLADGESEEEGRYYNSLFANPLSGAPAKAYIGGIAIWAAAMWFYWYVVPFTNGTTGMVTLAYPGVILFVGLVRALRKGSAS